MQLVILVVGKLAELFRRCKMLLGKVHLPLQGTSHSGEGRSAAQHCWVSFTQVKLWLQFLAKKVQVGAEHSAMAGALCVCTLLNIQQRELHYCFFLDWLSVTNVFAYLKATQGFCSDQALVALCLWVCPICVRSLWNWSPPESAILEIASEPYFFSVWQTSLLWQKVLGTTDNYA